MSEQLNAEKILGDAVNQGSSCFLTVDGVPICFETKILEQVKDKIVLVNTVPPSEICKVMNSSHHNLQVSMVRFQSKKIETDGKDLILYLEEDSAIDNVRQAERFTFGPDEKVICEFINPYDGQTKIVKTVLDMSVSGLSMQSSFDSQLFQEGTKLPGFIVKVDGSNYKQCEAEVVYKKKLVDLRREMKIQIGVKFL